MADSGLENPNAPVSAPEPARVEPVADGVYALIIGGDPNLVRPDRHIAARCFVTDLSELSQLLRQAIGERGSVVGSSVAAKKQSIG
jgi:hypothetical protein